MRTRHHLAAVLALLAAPLATGCNGNIEGSDTVTLPPQALSANGVNVTLSFQSDWGNGYCANVTLQNTGTAPVTSWSVVIEMGGSALSQSWNTVAATSGTRITFGPVGWNAAISGGSSVGFGFCGTSSSSSSRPTLISVSVTGGSAGGSGGATGAGGATGSGGAGSGGKGSGGAGSGGSGSGGSGSGGKGSGGSGSGGSGSGGKGSGGSGSGGSGSGGSGSGGSTSGFYTWPAYSPNIAYDYANEYGAIAQPTTVANDCSGVAGTVTSGWWTFRYGANKNSLVTANAWTPMLKRFNDDFAYITDVMRWPRDGRARSGNYSAIYLYGSGLCTDSASNTALGGWQSWVGNGPIVLASYYPVYSFDPACTYSDKASQQGAMIHEGIHSILATMPGCKNACWFQEGGNTWLQSTMNVKRSGTTPTSMGWLSAGAAIAPFMPIETYSGWLQDGSFGGPCAERVNMTNSSGQQICTWRRLLGGTQYGETFPHAMEVILGEKSVAWVWRYASKSGRVLQDLAEVSGGLGVAQTRRLIQEYRARQAFGDFGVWSTAYKNLINDNWKASLGPEWSPYWINVAAWTATPYASSTMNGSTLTPDTLTLPGWSGANQIPLTVTAGATSATVTFNPTGANMSCQLVYKDTSGNIRYGTPVTSGACTIPLANVKNNVVVAVIANTSYIYDGGTTKYGYSLTLGSGISGKADIYTQWYK